MFEEGETSTCLGCSPHILQPATANIYVANIIWEMLYIAVKCCIILAAASGNEFCRLFLISVVRFVVI